MTNPDIYVPSNRSRVTFRPHHIENKEGALRWFYLYANPARPEEEEIALAQYMKFMRKKNTSREYKEWGGSGDVIGDTKQERKRYLSRLKKFNRQMHNYSDDLPVRIRVTRRKDPLCRITARGKHCGEYKTCQLTRLGESLDATAIYEDINALLPGAATMRTTRRQNTVVDTTWGAITKYWTAYDDSTE